MTKAFGQSIPLPEVHVLLALDGGPHAGIIRPVLAKSRPGLLLHPNPPICPCRPTADHGADDVGRFEETQIAIAVWRLATDVRQLQVEWLFLPEGCNVPLRHPSIE